MKNKIFIISAVILLTGFWITAQNVNNVFAQAQDAKEQKTEPVAQSSNQDLLAIIEKLQNQIKDLQDQLAKLTSEVATVKEEIKITKELYKGVSGDEVKEVQKFLKQFSEIYPEGLVTGYYGPLTEKAVKKFQEQYDIPATGLVGPMTRDKIKELSSEEKIIICHYPPENPANKQTLEIGKPALGAHLAHGDTLDACPQEPAPTVSTPTTPSPTTPTPTTPAPTTPSPATPAPTSLPLADLQQRTADLQQRLANLQPPTAISITPISANLVTQFIISSGYAYGVTTDGSVLCWSTQGVIAGPIVSRDSALSVFCSLKDIARISPSYEHSCAVKTDGSAICWGQNQYGQLGNGTYSDDIETSPIPVSGLGPGTTADIAAGGAHTCALKKDGSVVCWGRNVSVSSSGQLGDGTKEPVRFTPTQVFGLGKGTTAAIFTNRAEGGGTCALKTNGAVVCWGEISVIGYSAHFTPVPAPDLIPGTIKYLGIGRKYFCALKTDNSVICSGRNLEGQLGDGTTKGATAITTGTYHTCALKKDGSVVCWGGNDRGQLGDGTIFYKYASVSVLGLGAGTTVAISADGDSTCALKTDGLVVCWPGSGKTAEGKSTRAPALVPLLGR
jgi:alpha-tubulin suppressor-like RCC1 family protein